MVTQQKGEGRGPGKLGRAAKTAMHGIVGVSERRVSRVKQCDIHQVGPLGGGGELPQMACRGLACGFDLRAGRAPRAGKGGQHLGEAGSAIRVFGRKIGAAVERLEVRRQPDAHGPAAAVRQRLDISHVDAVDVGPLLAVNLDRHEVHVQQPRDRFVFKRLVRHHVTPMAGRVTHRKEDRLVLAPRFGKGPLAPRIPVHGIVRMLDEIGAFLVCQTV